MNDTTESLTTVYVPDMPKDVLGRLQDDAAKDMRQTKVAAGRALRWAAIMLDRRLRAEEGGGA